MCTVVIDNRGILNIPLLNSRFDIRMNELKYELRKNLRMNLE